MQLDKITDDFYQISDVFPTDTLKKLIKEFGKSSQWDTLTATDKQGIVRHQYGVLINDPLSADIYTGLRPAIEFAEQLVGHKLYQNSPQLWEDSVGYVNEVHYDTSPNLKVNIQVYLSNSSVDNIGTHMFRDETWYSVPYRLNTGYIMINPTQNLHGTRYPVIDVRRSLYQSFRITEQQVDSW